MGMLRHKRGPPTSEDIKENAERTYHRYDPKQVMRRMGIHPKGVYFYVYGFTQKGKAVFWGPMTDDDEAESAARGLIDGEVFELETKDMLKASRLMKAELLRRQQPPDSVLRGMSHKRYRFWENKEKGGE